MAAIHEHVWIHCPVCVCESVCVRNKSEGDGFLRAGLSSRALCDSNKSISSVSLNHRGQKKSLCDKCALSHLSPNIFSTPLACTQEFDVEAGNTLKCPLDKDILWCLQDRSQSFRGISFQLCGHQIIFYNEIGNQYQSNVNRVQLEISEFAKWSL